MRTFEQVENRDTILLAAGLLAVLAGVALAPLARAQQPTPPAAGQQEPEPAHDPSLFDLDDLLEIEIISASKKPQKLAHAAAAVYVVSQEDIRRSGATSIPEALRMVPGLQVSRIDASRWAITARGFAGQFANKLLVLIDGRTVYTPTFSGVYWDIQDTMLEDIDRIEVIRGPGGTLWGANAVNGVINIITKRSAQTQGGLLTFGGGTEERYFGAARYGGALSDSATYRVYTKYFERDEAETTAGQDAADSWDVLRAGFRVDWDPSDRDAWTFQGDAYNGNTAATQSRPFTAAPFTRIRTEYVDVFGGNLLARWRHRGRGGSETIVQSYYDATSRDEHARVRRHTFDIDLQHSLAPLGDHNVMVGAGYRLNAIRVTPIEFVDVTDAPLHQNLVSLFVNDEIELVEDTLKSTLGSKFEYHHYSHFEWQPDARLLWQVDAEHTVWGAVSRAVRTPSQVSHDGIATLGSTPAGGGLALQSTLLGNPDIESEDLLAFDLGYRLQHEETFSLDLAGFYNEYDDVFALIPGTPFASATPVPRVVLPLSFQNSAEVESFGAEVAATWRVRDDWRLAGSYSYLNVHVHQNNSAALQSNNNENAAPAHKTDLRSYWTLTEGVDFDVMATYTDNLSTYGIPSFVRLDVRLAWRPDASSEFEVVVQNILDDRHPEFGTDFWLVPSEFERSIYAQFTQRF